MEDRVKLRTAYNAWLQARDALDTWIREVLDGRIEPDRVRGLRLVEDCQRTHEALMLGTKPFTQPK
jgi:hypothetical protein